jgi:hypothetical protein
MLTAKNELLHSLVCVEDFMLPGERDALKQLFGRLAEAEAEALLAFIYAIDECNDWLSTSTHEGDSR